MSRKLALAKRDAAVAKRVARWQNKFIAALTKTPSVLHACKSAGIGRSAAYEWRKKDPEFSERWQQAIEASIDDLESNAFKFALSGPPKEGGGAISAWVNLVTFMLKSHKRSIYGDKLEAAVAGGLIILPAKQVGPE